MDLCGKQQAHRLSLVSLALVLCILFFYQSLGPTSGSSGGSSGDSWLNSARQLQHEEPVSAISTSSAARSDPGRLKPSVELRVSQPPAPSPSASSSSSSSSSSSPPIPIQAAVVSSGADESSVEFNSSSSSDSGVIEKGTFDNSSSSSSSDVLEIEAGAFNSSSNSRPSSVSEGSEGRKRREIPEWRASLEKKLRAARDEIGAASSKTMQLDPQVTKSIYLNAYKFYKSYELMERMFKVYMYKEGEARLVHRGPLTGIYSSEGRFIHEMNQNGRFVTDDPQEAHMFFLPYSVAHMVLDLYVPGSHTMLPLATFIKDYVNLVASKHPFWNLTAGSDHFFVSCHDWGPATARDHPELRSNAVKVVCNADLTEEFVADKDASLPETYLHTVKLPTKLGGPGPTKRPYLAFFAGQMHGRVRPGLIDHWKDKDPDMKIYEVLPPEVAKKVSYVQHMRSSKFCICAMGFEVNSPRIVESIYYDCVPVIVADNFVLPFSDVLNWESFSLTVKESDVPRLKEILLGVGEVQYRRMQSRLKRVRQHFVWHDSGERLDMFHMILHSVWLRRLQQMDKIIEHETALVSL